MLIFKCFYNQKSHAIGYLEFLLFTEVSQKSTSKSLIKKQKYKNPVGSCIYDITIVKPLSCVTLNV